MHDQMALDLFQPAKRDYAAEHEAHLAERGVGREGIAVFRELVAMFGLTEAIDRSAAFSLAEGPGNIGWTYAELIDYLGLYDGSIDHHTVWDRKWAALKGYGKEEVERIESWDYARGVPVLDNRP